MLRHARKLEGSELRATDGQIGHVVDFFFDDRAWQVRYFVVDTGTWLENRKVLIAPVALGVARWDEPVLPVALTQEQVRQSPRLDPAQPVTREHETALLQYYNWPVYWTATAFPEVGIGFPMTPIPSVFPRPASEPETAKRPAAPLDFHLRSVRSVTGFHLEASDGAIGHVDDFLLDDCTWTVRYLVVDTRNWLPGKKVVIAPQWIRAVGWEDAKVHVDLSSHVVKTSPPDRSDQLVTPDYAAELHDHYGRPRHQ